MPLFPQPKLIIWYRLTPHKENSASVGQGAVGDSFLNMVASTLGSAGAYTQVIGTIGSPGQKKWYIENNGTYKDVPEPVSVILLLFGGLSLTYRRAA